MAAPPMANVHPRAVHTHQLPLLLPLLCPRQGHGHWAVFCFLSPQMLLPGNPGLSSQGPSGNARGVPPEQGCGVREQDVLNLQSARQLPHTHPGLIPLSDVRLSNQGREHPVTAGAVICISLIRSASESLFVCLSGLGFRSWKLPCTSSPQCVSRQEEGRAGRGAEAVCLDACG